MKKLVLSALSVAVMAAGSFAVDGKTLYLSSGCAACHKLEVDTIGPSLKKIASAYAGKEADLIKFLKGQGKPIVDPAKASIMNNVDILKLMKDDELKALAQFILSRK